MQKNNNISMVLFADAEKAFDRLEWPFIKKMISKMGHGSNLIAWLESVYKEPQALIKMNDVCSDPIM